MLKQMENWLRDYLEAMGTGTVHADYLDGIPGNYCLTYLGDQVLDRQPDILGNTWVTSRSHFYLKRLCVGPVTSWISSLADWCKLKTAQEDTPRQGILTLEGGKRLETNPDGTYLEGVDLYLTYRQYFEGEF